LALLSTAAAASGCCWLMQMPASSRWKYSSTLAGSAVRRAGFFGVKMLVASFGFPSCAQPHPHAPLAPVSTRPIATPPRTAGGAWLARLTASSAAASAAAQSLCHVSRASLRAACACSATVEAASQVSHLCATRSLPRMHFPHRGGAHRIWPHCTATGSRPGCAGPQPTAPPASSTPHG
jgi:hypothetical protein